MQKRPRESTHSKIGKEGAKGIREIKTARNKAEKDQANKHKSRKQATTEEGHGPIGAGNESEEKKKKQTTKNEAKTAREQAAKQKAQR